MKTKVYITIALMAFIAITAVFWIQSCRKPVGTIDITIPTTKLLLKGKVIDNTTKIGITNATVTIKGIAVVSTDKNGIYTTEMDVSKYKEVEIYAKASGYGLGSTKAYINKEQICVNSIPLKKLNTPVTIGPSGGKIETNNNEGFKTNKIELIIPANAFSSNVNISVTPFEGIEVPGKINDAKLNLVTVNINSGERDPLLPVTLVFPMPISNLGIDRLPLLYFNENNYSWENTGKYAIINNADGTASVNITHFTTYSLAIYGRYIEELSQTTTINSIELDRSGSSKIIPWLAKVEYPSGIPDNISANWLKNVVSQNTEIGTGRVSFFDSTYTTINYIGYKPDSISKTKSTMGCIRWVWRTFVCPVINLGDIIVSLLFANYWIDINNNGRVDQDEMYIWKDVNNDKNVDKGETLPATEVNGYVSTETYTDCGYWECIHDQGGGK